MAGLSDLRAAFSDVPSFFGIVKPIAATWIPTVSTERFVSRATILRNEVDRLAR